MPRGYVGGGPSYLNISLKERAKLLARVQLWLSLSARGSRKARSRSSSSSSCRGSAARRTRCRNEHAPPERSWETQSKEKLRERHCRGGLLQIQIHCWGGLLQIHQTAREKVRNSPSCPWPRTQPGCWAHRRWLKVIMSFRRIFQYFQEFPAGNCCFLGEKHCWLSRNFLELLPSPFSQVVVTHMLTPKVQSGPLTSHHTAQKVCVCCSPVSTMRVLVPGREEQLLLLANTKKLHLQLIQPLVICSAVPCTGFGVCKTGGQKKGSTVQPASACLIPYQAQLKILCDAKQWEKHNIVVKETLKPHLFLCSPWGHTQRSPITPCSILVQT